MSYNNQTEIEENMEELANYLTISSINMFSSMMMEVNMTLKPKDPKKPRV
jgi:hypothetical protein